MRYIVQKSCYVAVVAVSLMFLATGPLAAAPPPTTTFNLSSAGSGANLAGVYTSPYAGNLNGGPTIPVICDDFADDSYVPETWTAYVTSLSSLTSGTADGYLKWLNTPGATVSVDGYTLNQAQAYSVAAVLAVEILDTPVGTAQEDLSFAMWGLFYPTGTASDPGAFTQLTSYGDTTDLNNAIADLNSAVKYVETAANSAQVQADVNAVTIYSYDPTLPANPNGPTCNGAPCPNSPPQEFITVNMVEPPSTALLGFDLLAVAGVILFVRRRSKLAQA
jgi:hypothetical protein